MTFTELLYYTLYELAPTINGFVTRFPVTGYGSVYPSYAHLKSTIPSETRYELDEQWQRKATPAANFPITGKAFFDTMSPHHSHIKRLGADFDGDTCSFITVMSDQALQEISQKLKSASYYVDQNNQMYFSGSTDTVDYVLAYTTRDP